MAQQLSTGLKDLMQKEMSHYLQMLVAGTYGVPASLYWVGLQLSNQRASRQLDAIGFYSRTIFNMMQSIENKMNHKLIPMLDAKRKFRFKFNVSEMPLAQTVRLADNREKERWFQAQVINREYLYEFLNLDTSRLTEQEKNEWYQGNKGAGADMNNGAGEQDLATNNGLE
jgi:hypothetical protein